MSLSIKFLGTSASRPTVERGVSSIAITREGETMLIDCGEGTQRQMMRYGVSFALGDIFFTHFHTDHFIGVLGLLRTLTLQARVEPSRIWDTRAGGLLTILYLKLLRTKSWMSYTPRLHIFTYCNMFVNHHGQGEHQFYPRSSCFGQPPAFGFVLQ